MEKKAFNQTQVGIIKRICQNVYGSFEKVNRLNEKKAAIEAEINALQTQIDLMEQPVVNMCGYKSTDIVERVIVPVLNADGTPKKSDKGYAMKQTKWVLKYPDTIIPPVVEAVEEEVVDTPVEAEVNTEAEVTVNVPYFE